jgi:hypothetical protein
MWSAYMVIRAVCAAGMCPATDAHVTLHVRYDKSFISFVSRAIPHGCAVLQHVLASDETG